MTEPIFDTQDWKMIFIANEGIRIANDNHFVHTWWPVRVQGKIESRKTSSNPCNQTPNSKKSKHLLTTRIHLQRNKNCKIMRMTTLEGFVNRQESKCSTRGGGVNARKKCRHASLTEVCFPYHVYTFQPCVFEWEMMMRIDTINILTIEMGWIRAITMI